MKQVCLLLTLVICQVMIAEGQYSRYIIQIKDKKGTPYTLANPSNYLSAKAIERRSRQHIPLDSTDLPVSPAYLDSLRSVSNLTILNKSNWFNQVCIRTTDINALARVNAFPFVRSISPVASKVDAISTPVNKPLNGTMATESNKKITIIEANTINYGNTFGQIHIHEGEYLHNQGFTGEGITIAVLDAGYFGYKSNPAFDSVRLRNRVLGEWDLWPMNKVWMKTIPMACFVFPLWRPTVPA